jgi:hypothetical protein
LAKKRWILIGGVGILFLRKKRDKEMIKIKKKKKLGVKIKIRLFFELSKFFLRKLPTYCQYECG